MSTHDPSIERWCLAYLLTPGWAEKLAPPAPPRVFSGERIEPPSRPARGPAFKLAAHGEKSTGKSALLSAERRARLVHSFLHHELQAAELMAWAVLRFPDAPRALRRGLVKILLDEVRHMNLYAGYLRARGYEPGAFPVRDWFWERVPSCTDLPAFLATLGLGLEGANLDHASRFATRFREAGDEEAARIEEVVGREEIPHVRFALRWFVRLSPRVRAGEALFDAWRASLPEPLSPILMRGKPIARELRARAGQGGAFLEALEAFEP
jgi:uncharacterized ferritin-like protein (DUF455 family)